MNSVQIKIIFLILFVLVPSLFSNANCQTNEIKANPTKQYDEIIDLNNIEPLAGSTPIQQPSQQELHRDELTLLLPNLNSGLYQNWSLVGETMIWNPLDPMPDFITVSQDLLNELGIEKILKQSYKKEGHSVDLLIYKFKDFAGSYSAYTVLRNGSTTKLKVGKNASESNKLLNFWKGNYFVDIHTQAEDDSIAKEFIILASQDISNNIKIDQLPPVVAIQLPALNRVQGSEKYCLGVICITNFFPISDFNPEILKLAESGGIITAEYQLSDNPKDKDRVTLYLTRYLYKETAQLVFNSLQEIFENKKKENKEMDIDKDIHDSIVKIKNKKNDYTMLKQKGNMLAIAYGITDKKSGEKILDLVPWPIELIKPVNGEQTIMNDEKIED